MLMTGWHVFRRQGGTRWIIGRDGVPIDPTAEPPRELVAWADALNAERGEIPTGLVICERKTVGGSCCVTNGPADERGRWVAAFWQSGGTSPGALSVDGLDRVAGDTVGRWLHDFYGSEPLTVRRAREQREHEQQAKQAEAARRQAAADNRRKLLATVAECLIAPDAASVERMLPALAKLLRGDR